MVDVGQLVVIQDKQKFRDSVSLLCNKWVSEPPRASATLYGAALWFAPPFGAITATALVTGSNMYSKSMAIERGTGNQVKLKYYGDSWKPFKQIVGIVTEIIREGHCDLDVVKVRQQKGGVRYFRRFILENSIENGASNI